VLRGPLGFTAVGRHPGTNQSRRRPGERHAWVGLGSPGLPGNPVCRASGGESALASATDVVPWQGVRAAREFSPACMQSEDGWTDEQLADPGLWHESEDCLYLNVWTPAASANERLPVLLWIHAGAGIMGSAARPIYDGNALAQKGVVVIWLVCPSRVDRGIRTSLLRQLWGAGPACRAPVGEEQRRAVRRRPEQGHHVRAVGRMRRRQLPVRFPSGQGPGPGRDRSVFSHLSPDDHARRGRKHGRAIRPGHRKVFRGGVASHERRERLRRRPPAP